jgi:hypothetical protein
LENAAHRTGRPASIVSDQGSDLVKGIADYRELRPETTHIPDIVSSAFGMDQNGALARPKARESDRACCLRKSKKNREKSSSALEGAT